MRNPLNSVVDFGDVRKMRSVWYAQAAHAMGMAPLLQKYLIFK